jgi:hypothetical protein
VGVEFTATPVSDSAETRALDLRCPGRTACTSSVHIGGAGAGELRGSFFGVVPRDADVSRATCGGAAAFRRPHAAGMCTLCTWMAARSAGREKFQGWLTLTCAMRHVLVDGRRRRVGKVCLEMGGCFPWRGMPVARVWRPCPWSDVAAHATSLQLGVARRQGVGACPWALQLGSTVRIRVPRAVGWETFFGTCASAAAPGVYAVIRRVGVHVATLVGCGAPCGGHE